MSHPNSRPASHRRAILLGLLACVGSACASVLLLRWSLEGFVSAFAVGIVPVSQGFVVLMAALAAATCAAISVIAALGVLALAPVATGVGGPGAWSVRVAPQWGPRAATVLLALTLSAPAAHATPLSDSAADSSATRSVSTAGPIVTDGESESPSPALQGIPGWSPTTPSMPSTPDAPKTSPTRALPGTEPRSQPSPSLVAPRVQPTEGIVVTRGDTLWGVAARALGPTATDTEIAAAWPSWYATNRHVIGPNPHLLLPGQILQPPSDPGAQP